MSGSALIVLSFLALSNPRPVCTFADPTGLRWLLQVMRPACVEAIVNNEDVWWPDRCVRRHLVAVLPPR